jgi:hypothetical protein
MHNGQPVTDEIMLDVAERRQVLRDHSAAIVTTRVCAAQRDRCARIHTAILHGRATGDGLPSLAQATSDLAEAEARLAQAREAEADALVAMRERHAQAGPE